MKHYFIFRNKWIPKHSNQWPYYSFIGCLNNTTNVIEVPYVEKVDGKFVDKYNVAELVKIYELGNIGS
jgi:hypothetical protein